MTDIDRVIDDIYDGGTSDWQAVGRSLFNCLGANGGSLRFPQADGRSFNVFETTETAEASYSDYYFGVDPVRSALTRLASNQNQPINVMVAEDLLDGGRYRRSEFYQDFAKPHHQEHMLLGVVGDDERNVIGIFREDVPFGAREITTLSRLMPHIRRAVHLRRRLQRAEHLASLSYAAFEALPGCAVVVDSECHVLYANSAAEKCLSRRDLPVYLSSEMNSGKMRLNVDNRGNAARLGAMISEAAYVGNGGAMRFEVDTGSGNRIRQFALFVLPQPTQSSADKIFSGAGDPVLVMINELSRPTLVNPSLLRDLFGLSIAESSVAMALLGGQTSEAVARDRDVSLETVRTQIRMVLRKTNTSSLREFERIGAMLDMLTH